MKTRIEIKELLHKIESHKKDIQINYDNYKTAINESEVNINNLHGIIKNDIAYNDLIKQCSIMIDTLKWVLEDDTHFPH